MRRNISIRGAAAALLACFGLTVNAAAPLQKVQSPGYYRITLGSFEITALSDGSSPLPMKQLLTNVKPTDVDAALHESFLEDPVETSVNGFLINTGSRLVLIDTGAGNLLGPRQGKLLENLRASGYSPQQVDEIYITHMHRDHVGGLVADGRPVFPNAIVRAAGQEADFWLNARHMEAAPEALRSQFQAAVSTVNPYVCAGRFKPFDGETRLLPGLTARPAPGHTPGHTVYLVESNGQRLLIVGDLVHVAAVQFADPSVTVQFDADSSAAAVTRKSLLAEASDQRYGLAGAHLAFPGIGRVRANGSGYTFVPANYIGTPWGGHG